MKNSLKLIRIRDVYIQLHWTFLFFILWALVYDYRQGFDLQLVVWSFYFLVAILISIILHESGHALVASKFGINAKKITLYPLGGVASLEKLPGTPWQELFISLAGPAINIIIFSVLMLYVPQQFSFHTMNNYLGTVDQNNFLYNLAIGNLFLALINMVPAFPLDGGRLLRALLGFRFNYIRAAAIVKEVSKIIGWVMVAIGLVFLNAVLILTGLFVVVFPQVEESYLQLKSLTSGIKLKDVLLYDYNSLQSELTILEVANLLMNNHNKYFMVMDGANPIGTLNRFDAFKAIAEMRFSLKVRDIMKENLKVLNGESEVSQMIDDLSRHEEKMYPVKEDGQFIGVVSFQHIIEYLLINKALSKEYDRVRTLVSLL